MPRFVAPSPSRRRPAPSNASMARSRAVAARPLARAAAQNLADPAASFASAVATSSRAKHARRRAVLAGVDGKARRAARRCPAPAQRAVAGIGDFGFDLAEFRGGEAGLSSQRLAMDEGRIQRRRHQLVAIRAVTSNEVAEHVVVADFSGPDAGLVGRSAPAIAATTRRSASSQTAGLRRAPPHRIRGRAAVPRLIRACCSASARRIRVPDRARGAERLHPPRRSPRRVFKAARAVPTLDRPQKMPSRKPAKVARARRARPIIAPRARHVGRRAQPGADFVRETALSATKAAIASSRRGDRTLSVRGAASLWARRRDPAGVTVQSMASSSDPRRSPASVRVNSRLARVAGEPWWCRGFVRRRRQRRPFAHLRAVDIGDGSRCGVASSRDIALRPSMWRPQNNRTAVGSAVALSKTSAGQRRHAGNSRSSGPDRDRQRDR